MPRFYQLHSVVASRRDLDPAAKLLWAVIESRIRFKNPRWPGMRRLAAECGLSRNGAREAVKQLVEAGLLAESNGRPCRSHTFALGLAASAAGLCAVKGKWPTQLASDCTPRVPDVGHPVAQSVANGVTQPLIRPLKDDERGGETSLSPPLVLLVARIRKELGIVLSEKQAGHFEPLVFAGVPGSVVVDEFRQWYAVEKPWKLCGRIVAKWGDLRQTWRRMHGWYVGHRGVAPFPWQVGDLLRHGDAETVGWAMGPDAAAAALASRAAGEEGSEE